MSATPDPRNRPLLTLRGAVIFTLAGLTAAAAGALTYWNDHSWPGALLMAGVAFAGAVVFFNNLIK